MIAVSHDRARAEVQCCPLHDLDVERAVWVIRHVGNLVQPHQGYLELIDRAPASRRHVILSALRLLYPGVWDVGGRSGVYQSREARCVRLHSIYPETTLDRCARILLGESPVQVSGGILTRAEAHAWLAGGECRGAAYWLCDVRGISAACNVQVSPDLLGKKVVLWLVDRWRDPAQRASLLRVRDTRGPHGEMISGSYLERIDELRDRDLRPSVEDTYRRASMRLELAALRAMARAHAPLRAAPAWWRPIRCARILLTAAELAAEGRDLEHCAALYAEYVRRGESYVVALRVREHRSTVELNPHGAVLQHRGLRNVSPDPLCERALAVCLRRWHGASR